MQKEFGYVRGDIKDVREDVNDVKGAVAELGGQLLGLSLGVDFAGQES